VLVSDETGDDAAVYRLADGGGLVVSVDVFTPVVDDAYDWGRIAAANALSDIYAMGAVPAIALNIAGWPVDELPLELLADVLRGGRDVVEQAGASIVGGHTITTEREPLYGMVVIGFADPSLLLRNSGAEPGMTLVLTKPLGVGIVTTAIKRGVASPEQASAAVEIMTALNAAAARAALGAGVTAGTDVTGFGLLGHLRVMLEASGVAASIDAATVPLLDDVVDLAIADVVPSGTKRNHAWLAGTVDWGGLTRPEQLVLADAQTSGGLLLATHDPDAVCALLADEEVVCAVIGEVVAGSPGTIAVRGRVSRSRPPGAGSSPSGPALRPV